MTNYELLSIIFQIAISIVATATLIVYYRQLKVMSKQLQTMNDSSRAQSGLSLVSFLQAPEVRSARTCVREVLSQKPYTEWSSDERKCASLVTANYDVAAALVRSGLAPVELITANWGPSIIHCYQVLQPFIEEHRSRVGSDSRYWTNFKWLYEMTTKADFIKEPNE